MRAVFEKAKFIVDGDTAYLCVAVPAKEAKRFVGEMKPKKYDVEIKEHRERRSLDANRYFWKILDEMAAVLGRRKEDLYSEYVKQCGPFKDFVLTEDEAKTFKVAWSMLGTGWVTEQVDYDQDGERIIVRAYYGSSRYSRKQMSRLIDLVVEDAKELGIETMTPLDLERLKDEWRKK